MKQETTQEEKVTAALKKAHKAYKAAYADYKKQSKGGTRPSANIQLAAKTTLHNLLDAFSEHVRVNNQLQKKKR